MLAQRNITMLGLRKLFKFCIIIFIAGSLLNLFLSPALKANNVYFANVCHENNVSDKQNINNSNTTLINKNKTCFKLYWNNPDKEFLSSMDCNHSATGNCFRFLTIQKVIGRLGNQMFLLASLFGLACEYDLIPIVPASATLITKYFDIPNIVDENKIPSTNFEVNCVGERFGVHYNCSKEFNDTTQRGIWIIRGEKYLQSWKYFHECKDLIGEIFRLKEEYIKNARKFMEEMSINGSTSVCIHVRRGDALAKIEQNLGREVVNETDIQKAQQYYEEHFPPVKFIVLSDDIAWCNRTIKGNVVFSPFTDPGDDMALMMLCDHVIVTSGSFGWWGAWFSGGTTLYFKGFIRPNSTYDKDMNNDDYYPSKWIPY